MSIAIIVISNGDLRDLEVTLQSTRYVNCEKYVFLQLLDLNQTMPSKVQDLINNTCDGFNVECDTGIYNAFNRALNTVTKNGILDHYNRVIFMNSGDKFVDRCYLFLSDQGSSISCNAVTPQGKSLCQSFNPLFLQYPHHQGLFYKSEFFKTYRYPEHYRIAGDLDSKIRLFREDNVLFINEVVAIVDPNGISSQRGNLALAFKRSKENATISRQYFGWWISRFHFVIYFMWYWRKR